MKRRGRVKYPHLVFFFESTNPCDGECDVSVGEMGYFWNDVEFTCHAMECDPGA